MRLLRNDAAHTGIDFRLSTAKRREKVKALRHAIRYDDPSESEGMDIPHEKYVWGLRVGAICLDIFRDFHAYSDKHMKMMKAVYEELLMQAPAFKHGLLAGMFKTPAGKLKGLLDP
jgi:hypothetical protein